MRKVFSSQRIETVERVAQRLRQAGVEVYIRNGRSWQGKRGGQFSYLDRSDGSKYPAIWVVRADDQVQARQLLREMGLLETTRPLSENAPSPVLTFNASIQQKHRGPWRWRALLLLLISLGVLFTVLFQQAQIPVQQPSALTPALQADENSFRVPIYLSEE